tara:strand:- start:24 stop:611 length:588 start_codon:yes stop_codon:yes gene_type:complete
MKKLLTIIILGLLWSNTTQAEDINDFEIEGISIGDSLLDYFTEKEIKNPGAKNIYFYPNSRKFYEIVLNLNSTIYDEIQFSLKDKDDSYKIYNINGTIFFKQNISKCHDKKNEIESDLSKILNMNEVNIYPETGKHTVDKTGRSTYEAVWYVFKSGDHVGVICTDYHIDMNNQDSLKLLISSKEYNNFLRTEAYE